MEKKENKEKIENKENEKKENKENKEKIEEKIEKKIEKIKQIENEIREYGYHLLSRQDYCINDLKEKLFKKFSEKNMYSSNEVNTSIIKIINEFIEKKYLNDEAYVKFYILLHHYGRKKYEYIFSKKNIASDIYIKILDENIEKEINEIKDFLIKSKNNNREKNIRVLISRGFQYEQIKKVMLELE
ncbi:MAG: RecX family transcriptional regulator [Fusobacteriaceae bacterium]|jgi:SOS response regulatory protein OraA/RecX|nr:RecX family transcriptional regulator [Fusobacteriaceae bacterium]